MGSAVYFLACARRLREPEQKESIAMIIEVTTLHIHPGQNQAFEAAITQAAQSLLRRFPAVWATAFAAASKSAAST